MGEVYRARDPRLQREVAIKVLPPHLADNAVARERFRREALAAAALDHPFICKIFEIAEHDDTIFIVMEYVVGETLHARLSAERPPASVALRIAGEIAEALEAAHAKRIVHRDLKPANVMLTTQGRVKVMDFGLAKQLGPAEVSPLNPGATEAETAFRQPPLTDGGMRLGTPDYMSPEQVLSDKLDERSDLFAFGIVLCELLTATHPFRRSSSGETMTAILREPPSIAGDAAVGLQGPLTVMIRRLLAKAPTERYATIAELRIDLSKVSASSSGGTTRLATPDARPTATRRPLVGRDSERAELVRGLEDAIAGRGSIVLVGGEPGIGKTRLTQEMLADARQRECVSLVGHCYEGEGAPPYVPFIEMLEYSTRIIPPATFRHALGDSASEVAKLMPELRRIFSDIPPPIELPAEQQRRFLFNAYREFMDRCCRMTPLVVVLEDLHWADEPTLLLLQHLAQTMSTTPLLVVGTYRDVELDVTRPFARTLETLLRQRLATRISLQRLPLSGVESMLRGMSHQPPPSSLTRVIFQETEGNPFFVEEVFQHLAEDGKLFAAGGAWRSDLRVDTLQVPEGVRLVIGRRLQRLSDAARRVLTTAAVVGRTFSLSLIETLETTQPDAALDALEEAERAHLVVAESGREPRYRFAHELIRQTLAETLSLPRRQRVHARIAEAIERVYAASLEKHVSALAHHLYQAGTAADAEKTSKYLLVAAEQTRAAAAHEESLAHLDNAVSLWEGEVSGRIADIHARRAAGLRSLGRIGEAIEVFKRAIALFDEAGDVEKMAVTSVDLGWVHFWNADMDAALHIAREALDRLGEAIPMLRCRLLLLRAMGVSGGAEPDAAFAVLAEAQQLQRSLSRLDLDREGAVVETFLLAQVLEVDRVVSTCRNAVRRCRASRDVWSEVDVGFHEPWAALCGGRVTEGVRLIEEQRPLAERVGHQRAEGVLRQLSGAAAMFRADLEAAERIARESVAFGQALASGWRFLDSLLLGLVNFFQGRSAEAIAYLQDATDTEPQTFFSGCSASSLAWVLAHEGDPSAADVLRGRPPRLPAPGKIATIGTWFALVNTVESLALVGRRDEAAALHASTEGLAATGVHCYAQVSTTMFASAAGVAAACARQWTRAEAHHQLAIQQADAAYRIFLPDARVWYADMLLARNDSGDRDRARALLAEALSLYESIGMPGFARRTSARLAGL